MLYSSGGRPATAFSPMLGISASWYTQTSVPLSLWMLRGAYCFHLSGRWASNIVGRLDDVVVDAHQDQVLDSWACWRPLVGTDVGVSLRRPG